MATTSSGMGGSDDDNGVTTTILLTSIVSTAVVSCASVDVMALRHLAAISCRAAPAQRNHDCMLHVFWCSKGWRGAIRPLLKGSIPVYIVSGDLAVCDGVRSGARYMHVEVCVVLFALNHAVTRLSGPLQAFQ